MRPKVVIGVLLSATLAAALLLWSALRPQPSRPAEFQDGSTASSLADPKDGPALAILKPAPGESATVLGQGTNGPSPDPEHAKYVRKRVYELNALAMKSDPASRDAILAELENPDRAIRKGALEAAIQFGDRSVVPRLKQVAEQTEDPAEKAEILAAIDYINLPSLSEYLADQRAKMAALGMTNLPRTGTNRVRRSQR